MHIARRISQTLAVAAVFFTAAVAVVGSTFAATVSSANDYPSTLQTSQSANHTALFTTPSGVSEGRTITLTFASAFDTSSLTEDDIDIADDGTDLTTAADCTGAQQASVAIAADVVTITVCAGDGGAIAATSAVTIEIGTNATSSGTGANQVTNPTSTGNYYLSIAGTFGDSGSIVLPIGGDDTLGVTATVPSSSSGSSGSDSPAGDPADTSAPNISGIVVSGVTASSATVSWTTSEAATRLLDYGLTTAFELGTQSVSGYYTSHSITLTGLTQGATHYFQIRAADISGNAATSSTQSFATLDETAPVISSINVVDITTTSARITWTTDEAANSTVAYGLATSYGSTAASASLVTSHSMLLTGLSDGTTYHFQVLSTDASSNQSFSSDRTFITDTDNPPGNVANLAAAQGNGQLVLSWTNPSDDDLSGIRILRCLGAYPGGPTDSACTTVSTSLATGLTQTGLTNGITYYYGVFAFDEAGQFASGALVSGTPQAPEEEVPFEEESSEEEPSEEEAPSEEPGGEEAEVPPTDTGTDELSPSDSAVSCGDDVCSLSESSVSCPLDCGAPEEPTSLGAEVGTISDADLLYLVANQSIALTASRSGVVEVLPTSTLRIAIPATVLSDGVQTIVLDVGSDRYLMRLDDAFALYSTDLTVPREPTIIQVSVLVTYDDGSTQAVSSYLRVVPTGEAIQVIDGEEAAVDTATVTLFELDVDDGVWDGSPYGQFNPVSVGADGSFAWYVPSGTYRVTASAPGFASASSDVLRVNNSIVAPRILLVAIKKEEPPIVESPSQEAPPETPAATLAQTFIDALPIEAAQQGLEAVRELPGVQEAAEISVPTLAITAGASVVVLSVAFDFLPFLQYLFTAPILFFWRRRRKGYGVVYNAIAKTPVDLAVVRLFKIDDEAADARGRLLKSRVTDKGGRYFFLVPPGKYRIQVTKPGFTYPSEYLKDEKQDGAFLDVYHGEPIEVTAQGALISANIPIDPSQAQKYQAPSSVRRRAFLRTLQHGLAFGGIIAAGAFAIIRPTVISVSMVGVQVLIYLLARRLAKPHKPISWGIVYDKMTLRPLSRVVARVFEPKYNKLLETQVTDSKGRYAFILGPNRYYATFKKDGFKQASVDPIDYSDAKEPKGFAQEVPLESDGAPAGVET